MLYIDRITLHNFKSFRHANVSFSKGFSCIVGPNGSGKSNVCDALLFSLGESSLRRMRVSSSKLLINALSKPKKEDGVKRAYVHITFAGDENLEIVRMIKSNNKIAYRINGKRAARQDVLEVLKAHNAVINETNTIAQGEIDRILHLTPRERRELIDIAAGIKEFDEKRDSAMKELEKVETKITEAGIMLNEREGFLNELEKEKADAEKYLELSGNLKRTSYTILKAREGQINDEYRKAVEGYERATARKKELEDTIKKLDDQIAEASSYRESVSKKLNEGSIGLSAANRLLEELNSNIRIKEAEIASTGEAKEKSRERSKALKQEFEEINAQKEANTAAIAKHQQELVVIQQDLAPLDIGSTDGEGGGIVEKYSEARGRLEVLEAQLSEINGEYVVSNAEVSRLEGNLKDMEAKMSVVDTECSAKMEEQKRGGEAMASSAKEMDKARKALSGYKSEVSDLRDSLLKIDSDRINAREALALSGRSFDRISSVLKDKVKTGFYGKASELCSYDEKYAIAVYAAAASRLNYLVVDSAETASDAIGLIKERNLGRASFIPIKDVSVKDTPEEEGLERLIDVVTFDKKYEKAFRYIFSNTYIAKSIAEAKKSGIGNRRYVTMEGELVEQSGIITGGRLTQQQLPGVMEAKLKKLEAERLDTIAKIADLEGEEEKARKRAADLEVSMADMSANVKHAQLYLDKQLKELEELRSRVMDHKGKLEKLDKSRQDFASRKISIEKEIEARKEECNTLYSALNRAVGGQKSSREAKAAAAKLKALRERLESTKIGIASLEKENEVREERIRAISKELKEEDASVKACNAKVKEAEAAILGYGKKKSEVQENIKSHSQSSESLLKELQEAEEKLDKLSTSKGRAGSDSDKVERELMETESRRAQLQTRLSDIKAELMSYAEVEQVEYSSMEELERAAVEYRHGMELLGNVNLKAPEAYAQRKKDVDEAKGRMATLGTEKDSILTMINEIESKKLSIFNDTFNEVNENFKRLYNYTFDGSAHLYLDNPAEPFNARLHFNIQAPNKKQKQADELSGGQKSLLMLALIFSIQMRKPMSFYIFDEIDSSLDKENSKKLSKLIKELSNSSQFIVVSHNDSLIAAADAAIGVTKQNEQSQVVGIQIASRNGAAEGA